jgi:ornithine cyclodeaminase/alanine dehydrogenase-like protein (mu-crystallin family)
LIYLSNADVQQVLDMPTTLEALRTGYRDLEQGQATHIPRIDLYMPTGRDDDYYRWGSMTGASRTYGVLAVRIKSDIVYWPDGRTEEKYCIKEGTYSGIILLYSTRNGEPLALINDGYLQHLRVGGGAGLGTDLLARQDARVLGLLGSGGMAHTYLLAISQVRALEQIRVYSPTRANREHFAREMSTRLRLPISPVDSPEAAVHRADIVASATDSLGPTIRAE